MTTAIDTVNRFLHALEVKDYAQIDALLSPDLVYTNVSLPSIKGGKTVSTLFERLMSRGAGFEVQIHSIAANGDTVMTERTDILKVGPLRVGFWVCGTFRVVDGRIVLWRDYFDWLDIGRATVRGVLGIPLPRLRVTLPVRISA
jgi:limonene-1,2-epoxide hydrolase